MKVNQNTIIVSTDFLNGLLPDKSDDDKTILYMLEELCERRADYSKKINFEEQKQETGFLNKIRKANL